VKGWSSYLTSGNILRGLSARSRMSVFLLVVLLKAPGLGFSDALAVRNCIKNQEDNDMGNAVRPRSVLWYRRPAREWIEGLPVGNGSLGGMVLGDPVVGRVALNHDHLWRRYWSYQDRKTAEDMPVVRKLCQEGKWREAFTYLDGRVQQSGRGLYVNPYVPLGDLYIIPAHSGNYVDYERQLDLDTGIVTVQYTVNAVRFQREYYASAKQNLLAIRLSADHAACISCEIALSRLFDPDCEVTGLGSLGHLVLEGRFEEGVPFAAVVEVLQQGGRLTGGRKEYEQPQGEIPGSDLSGSTFIHRSDDLPQAGYGVSTCVDSADEVIIYITMATDWESTQDPVGWCLDHLASVSDSYEEIRSESLRDHQGYYRRVKLRLGNGENDTPTDEVLDRCRATGTLPSLLVEQLFNLGRYLAIASSRPGTAPINLQGIWNQDRRPAWDSDYHLDMNVQMCYWPLYMANLIDCVEPLFDWVERLLPQARHAAQDLYGCRGVYFPGTNDLYSIGNIDNLGIWWTGAAAWLAQLFWMYWEYTGDREFLRRKAYRFLAEVGRFYRDFLTEDEAGNLIPCPSMSPEQLVKPHNTFLSPPSTMDLELCRETFKHLIEASEILDADSQNRQEWRQLLDRLPLPPISADGCLLEWMGDVEPGDPGHRHLSHLVGLCPGTRITAEETPEYFAAAAKAITERKVHSDESGCAWGAAWMGQMYARLYEPDKAFDQIKDYCCNYAVGSLLSSIVDWRDDGTGLRWFDGAKVFQIEASFGIMAVVSEMILQDQGGVLRLLPALPQQMASGHVEGLRARGGFEVDITWDNGRLTRVRIKSLLGNRCHVKIFDESCDYRVVGEGEEVEIQKGRSGELIFPTGVNQSYQIVVEYC